MVNVVILVPRRADQGRRDIIWQWISRQWLPIHHPHWPVVEGNDVQAEFSMARARNAAARGAGDWDVAVIMDSDTIAHPQAVREAVDRAANTDALWVAGDMRMRMDKRSSDRLMTFGSCIPRPEGDVHPKRNVIQDMVYGEPSSGVMAIGRTLWDKTGGYLESMNGWGWEDLVFITQCCVVGDGINWVRNEMLMHIYHERTPVTADTHRNYKTYKTFHDISCRSKARAKQYLETMGHTWG